MNDAVLESISLMQIRLPVFARSVVIGQLCSRALICTEAIFATSEALCHRCAHIQQVAGYLPELLQINC